MKKLIVISFVLTALLGGLLAFQKADAQTTQEPAGGFGRPRLTVPFPGSDQITGPGSYIRAVYQFGLGFGALLAMTMIVIGAVQYTLSEAVTSKEDAKDRIMKAIWGLILLLAATVILFTVNPDLPNLTEPGAPELEGSVQQP